MQAGFEVFDIAARIAGLDVTGALPRQVHGQFVDAGERGKPPQQ